MAKYRRLSRTIALQTLAALLGVQGEDKSADPAEVERHFVYIKQEFAPEIKHQDEFARSLIAGVLAHRPDLDAKITQFAPEWPLNKLSPIERVILETGTFELVFAPETPLPVIVNEWVDIAKEFGDDTAGKFINGVLSNLGHAVRPNEATVKSA